MSYDFLGFIRLLPPQSVKITWGQSWHDKTSDTFSSFVSPIWGKICVLQALDWILLEHSERKTVPPYRIGPVKIEWQESILNFACFFWYQWRRNYEVGEVVCKSTLCCINQRWCFKKIFIVFNVSADYPRSNWGKEKMISHCSVAF